MAGKRKTEEPAGAPQEDGSMEPDTNSSSGSVVDSAKEAASQVMDQVRDQATIRADQQRQTVASGFVSVADAVRRMSDGLREHDEGPVAHYASELGHALGDRVEGVAHYLRDRDVRQLMRDTEDFARRSPGMFLGGAFVLGLAASRFLKSSRSVPDYMSNLPDPNRALPPARTNAGQSKQSYAGTAGTPSSWSRVSTAEPAIVIDPTGGIPAGGGASTGNTGSAGGTL